MSGFVDPFRRLLGWLSSITNPGDVIRGQVQLEYEGGVMEARAGQAIVSEPGEWIRYSTPAPGGAEYIAICLPAFSVDIANRDEE